MLYKYYLNIETQYEDCYGKDNEKTDDKREQYENI